MADKEALVHVSVIEWRPSGHRLAYVAAIIEAATSLGQGATLLTTPEVVASDEFRVHLSCWLNRDAFAIELIESPEQVGIGQTLEGFGRALDGVRSDTLTILPEADKFLVQLLWGLIRGRLPIPMAVIVMRPPQPRPPRQSLRGLAKLATILLLDNLAPSINVHLLEDPLANGADRVWRWPLSSKRLRLDDPCDLRDSSGYGLPPDIQTVLRETNCVAIVGSIDSRKNLPLAIEAWSSQQAHEGESLLLLGKQSTEVSRWLAQRSLPESVYMLDRYLSLTEIVEALRGVRAILVLYDGGLSSSILTAAAATGTQVIALEGSRTGRVAASHRLGITCKARPHELMSAIIHLLHQTDAPSPLPCPTPLDFGLTILDPRRR